MCEICKICIHSKFGCSLATCVIYLQQDENLQIMSERYNIPPGTSTSEILKRLKEEEDRVRREIQKELKIKEGVEKMRVAATESRSSKSHISAEIKKSVTRLDELNHELSDLRTCQLMTDDGSGATVHKSEIYSLKYFLNC